MHKDLLSCEEITKADLEKIIELSAKIKRERFSPTAPTPLTGKSVGMIFAKSSTRTRVSFEVGIHELGGYPVYLDQGKMQMGRGETPADTARVLSRYLRAIVIRTYGHDEVVELAKFSSIPIINALTDDYHPCQAITDVFTMYEFAERLEGLKMAFLGDGSSNMANSLMLICQIAGIDMVISAPEQFKPRADIMKRKLGPGKCSWTSNPEEAVKDADFLYTDVWVSMGFEKESEERVKLLQPYQLDMKLLNLAKPDAKVLHCLPAHRGEEITDDVLESDKSIVFDQAENRLHVQKAIMSLMLS